MLIFTNAFLCSVIIETKENTAEIAVLDTTSGYHQFQGTFMSMRLSSAFNETDPKCEWQAFQAVAYDPSSYFVGEFSDIVDKDNFFAVSTIPNDLAWIVLNDVSNLTNVKMVLGYYFGNIRDKIDIFLGSDSSPTFCADTFDSPQLNYLIRETKSLWGGLDLIYNKDFGHSSYPHNTYCRTLLNNSEGYQYKLWFEQYHVEPHFDNVTVDTAIPGIPTTLKNSVYIVPSTDFVLKFDSDGSINQAGFILHIEKYACDCGENVLIVPCNGSRKRRYFMNSDDPSLFCEMTCIFQIKMKDNCLFNYLEIHYQFINLEYLTMTVDYYISNQSFFSLYNHKLVHYYDPLSNYSIAETISDYLQCSIGYEDGHGCVKFNKLDIL
uniref:CUB domain-containing protein n=1 Tax=Panagrolaimus sp. JU765 TaxID=591449 RepID=A0AC34RC21_9BILA